MPDVRDSQAPGRFASFLRPLTDRLLGFYQRHARLAPATFFAGGVAWDAVTLRRIDALVDNVILLAYLVALGVFVLVALLAEYGGLRHPLLLRYRAWYPAALQFFLGALLSAYVVFYFQSVSFTSTSLFFVLLVALLTANEFIHRRLANLYLLLGLYYVAAFSFLVFFIPVVARVMGYLTFLAAGLVSAAIVAGMISILQRRQVFTTPRQYAGAILLVAVLFGVFNLFYAKDWIPPVPLALRQGGIYHNVERVGSDYLLTYEQPPWYRPWVRSERTFRYAEGDAVYCFAAVFAPLKLTTRIFHEWRYYDARRGSWVTTDHLGYEIHGGRGNGWRGYTRKQNMRPGQWRVDVQTEDGRTLGRIRFEVVPAEHPVEAFTTLTYD